MPLTLLLVLRFTRGEDALLSVPIRFALLVPFVAIITLPFFDACCMLAILNGVVDEGFDAAFFSFIVCNLCSSLASSSSSYSLSSSSSYYGFNYFVVFIVLVLAVALILILFGALFFTDLLFTPANARVDAKAVDDFTLCGAASSKPNTYSSGASLDSSSSALTAVFPVFVVISVVVAAACFCNCRSISSLVIA